MIRRPPRSTRVRSSAASDVYKRAVKGWRVGLRRLVEAGELAHELQRGGVDFILGRGRFEIEQRLDVPAHWFFLLDRPGPDPNTCIAGLYWHRMSLTLTPSPPCANPASSRWPISPTRSFSMTAAGPTPSTGCFRRPFRPVPPHSPPPSAPPPSSARPGVPRRSNTRPTTANGIPKPPPAPTVR